MQIIGKIIGFLIAFIFYLIASILRPFLNLLGFHNVKKPKPPVLKQFNKEVNFKKGEDFEQYIRNHLFPKDRFILVERTHNYETNKSDFVESTLKPDFKFRSIASNSEFYIEAKWRSKLHNNVLKWSYESQFERYKVYAKQNIFYVVIGLGGTPSNPENLYLSRIQDMDDFIIYKDELQCYNFHDQMKKYKLN